MTMSATSDKRIGCPYCNKEIGRIDGKSLMVEWYLLLRDHYLTGCPNVPADEPALAGDPL